jgi:hydrogenase/urease accessory protein HupE
MGKSALLISLLLMVAVTTAAHAHEIRPGFLEITQFDDGRVRVMWKQPMRGQMALPIQPILSSGWLEESEAITSYTPGARVMIWNVDDSDTPLLGQTVTIAGLEMTLTDVLLKVTLANGTKITQLLRPESASLEITEEAAGRVVIRDYLRLGIEHILLGVDHLLFVFGLLLLSKGFKPLLKTITSFTVGHSISLALATLGVVHVPAPPLNAAIALSIVFLAAELVRARRGEMSVTIRRPWLVSFGFGLIHGLGFASALVSLGLPESSIPPALLFFNVGVEIGQVLFIVIVLALLASWRKMEMKLPAWGEQLPAYAMGSIASVWFVGRFVAMIVP